MSQRDIFAPILKSPTTQSIPDLRQRYYFLRGTWGDDVWKSPEGKALLQELEREEITETTGDFVFSDPTTIIIFWELLDYLEQGFRNFVVVGERGVGKEVIANVIGLRSKQEIISVNCATLVDSLADALLFGISEKAGLPNVPKRGGTQGFVGAANGKVLFLDEFFDAPISVFPKLLRLLQEPRSYQRIGDPKELRLDEKTIIVAASNRYTTLSLLDAAMADGDVRSDLIERFQARLELPPLRARTREIGDIAKSLLKRLPGKKGFHSLNETTVQSLRHSGHRWPGNVRELESLLAKHARQQHHVLPADGALNISEQAIRAWISDVERREISSQWHATTSPSSDGLSAWDAQGLRTLRLCQLLRFLLGKRTDAGLGQVDARWVSASLPPVLQVSNASQKLRDSLDLNINELTSLLNEFSDSTDRKLAELATRITGRKKTK